MRKVKKESVVQRFLTLGLIVSLFVWAIYSLPAGVTAEPSEVAGTISGQLVAPDGGALPDGMAVALYSPNDGFLREMGLLEADAIEDHEPEPYTDPIYQTSVDSISGSFTFTDTQNGRYVLIVIPSDDSNLIGATTPFLEVFQTSYDVGSVQLVEAQISGRLFKPGGITEAKGIVSLVDTTETFEAATSSIQGRYFFNNIPAGEYQLTAAPFGSSAPRQYRSNPVTVVVTGSQSIENLDISFRGPDIIGTVTDPSGRLIYYPYVYVKSLETGEVQQAERAFDDWYIGDLSEGSYEVQTYASEFDYELLDFLPPDPVLVNVPTDTAEINFAYELWPEGIKVLTGKVVDDAGNPAQYAPIRADSDERKVSRTAIADENGEYQIDLVGGDWVIDIEESLLSGVSFIYPGSPISITFAADDEIETREHNFDVISRNATVTGRVNFGDVDEIPNYEITIVGQIFDVPITDKVDSELDENEFKFFLFPDVYDYRVRIYSSEFERDIFGSFTVATNQVLDLGNIFANPRNATIKGRVVDVNGEPEHWAELNVWHFEDHSGSERSIITDEDGYYEINVPRGVWVVDLYDPYGKYFSNGPDYQVVEIENEEIKDDVDFEVVKGTSTIVGQLTNDNKSILGISGSVIVKTNPMVDQKYSNVLDSFPLRDGQFEISIAEGAYLLNLDFLDFTSFVVDLDIPVLIGANETITIEIPIELETNSASIIGSGYDLRTGEQVSVPNPRVEVRSPDIQVLGYPGPMEKPEEDDPFDYKLGVHPGTWYVRLSGSSDIEGYAAINRPDMVVEATENTTSTVNLPLVEIDASVSGQIVGPDQSLVEVGQSKILYVSFEGLGDLYGERFSTASESGSYFIKLPAGEYIVTTSVYIPFLGAEIRDYLQLKEPFILSVSEGDSLTDVTLELEAREDNVSTVSGSVFAQDYPEKGYAFLSLYLGDRLEESFRFPLHSTGTMAVGDFVTELEHGEWDVVAYVVGDRTAWSNRSQILVDGTTSFAIEVFPDHVFYEAAEHMIDPLVDGKIGLSDGISVTVPVGVLTDTAQIQLDLKQGNYLATNGENRPVGSAYALTARHSLSQLPYADFEFDQPIEVTIPYDLTELEPLLANEIKVMIRPSNELLWWMPPTLLEGDDLVVDTEAQTITFAIDATAQFGLVAPAGALPQPPTFESVFPNRAFFPIVGR